MKSFRTMGALGFMLGVLSCLDANELSQAAPLFTRINDPVSIPAVISDHEIFVSIMVNGHGPFRVMVDTGCSMTLVSPELAEAVGAIDEGTNGDDDVALNGLGDDTEVHRIALGVIELGAVRFEGVQAAVSDSFTKLSAIEGQRIDGALGFPLFAELYLGLDFPNQRVLLSRTWPALAPPVIAILPVNEHIDVPFVNVQIQGTPIEVMVDSGANQALHLPVEIASALLWKEEPRAGALVAVVGELSREGIGRLAGNLTVGATEQIEPTAVISPGLPSIGIRSLDHYCVIFSQSQKMMWLCGTDSGPVPPTPERTTGLSLYAAPGGWRIAGVIPGSPADEANLTTGSLVTQIEQQPAASWTRDQMQQWIESHSDIALLVAAEFGERAVTLRSWSLVP